MAVVVDGPSGMTSLADAALADFALIAVLVTGLFVWSTRELLAGKRERLLDAQRKAEAARERRRPKR